MSPHTIHARLKKGYFADYQASCETCDKVWESRNAQAVAAKHTLTTGHETHVEIAIHWQYNRA